VRTRRHLNIPTAEEARAGFEKITNGVKQKLPGARLLGVEVEATAGRGTKVILGISKDPAFGYMIMFGLTSRQDGKGYRQTRSPREL
jgi:acetyltransferase